MKNNTNKTISKMLCVALLASMMAEAPIMAANSGTIPVNVGGQTVNVTPGQWVTVNNGGTTASYNVRYVNGQAVALDVKQYTSLVLGDTAAATTAANNVAAAQTAQTAAQTAQTAAQTAQTSATTAQAADVSVTSGAKTTTSSKGSWIKNELAEYGNNIKNSFNSGKESGQNFGNKTVDTVKTGGSKIGNAFKSLGSKIGGALKTAKDKVTGLFKKNDTTVASEKGGKGSSEASQSGETSSQTSQSSEQSSQTSQTSEQSAQSTEQAAQTTEQASQAKEAGKTDSAKADTGKKEGLFSKLKNKAASGLKSGYEAGKAMTKQGVQNVKDSLKSGFSAKNLLMTAGITVATDVATQIMRGEKPSLKKALQTVCCAEFAGSVVGSVTGAAAGSFFTPFLSAIPVVGGVLSALAPTFGSVVGSSVGAYLAGDLKNGRFSLKNAIKSIDWAGVVGQTIGSTAGAALGSCLGPVGTIIGGIVGGYVGNWAAQKLKTWFGGSDSYGSIGMPVGTSVLNSGVVASEVTIGSVAGSEVATEIPVANSAVVPESEIAVSASAATMGTYSSEIQLAEAKYQELYQLYNEMLSQGRQADAIKVAQEMNAAKSEYEALKAKNK